jgi:hypothetical protein
MALTKSDVLREFNDTWADPAAAKFGDVFEERVERVARELLLQQPDTGTAGSTKYTRPFAIEITYPPRESRVLGALALTADPPVNSCRIRTSATQSRPMQIASPARMGRWASHQRRPRAQGA